MYGVMFANIIKVVPNSKIVTDDKVCKIKKDTHIAKIKNVK